MLHTYIVHMHFYGANIRFAVAGAVCFQNFEILLVKNKNETIFAKQCKNSIN